MLVLTHTEEPFWLYWNMALGLYASMIVAKKPNPTKLHV